MNQYLSASILPDFLLQNPMYLQITGFVLTLILGILFTRRVLAPLAERAARRRGTDKKARHSIVNLVDVIGLFATFVVALQVGNFGGLVTLLGTIAAAATVAIGFGMRDQVSSVVAGVFIHTDNPYVKGDFVKVGEYEGVVRDISLRATVLNGSQSEKQVVPNNMMTQSVVKNYTKGTRTKTTVSVTAKPEHAEKAAEILLEAAENEAEILETPEPSIIYPEIEDGKMKIDLHYWIKDSVDVKSVRSNIYSAFGEKGVEAGIFDEKKED